MPGTMPVRVMDPASTQLTLVGCGGTGAFAAKNACRLLWGLAQQRRAAHAEPPAFGDLPPEGVPEVLLCDGDLVERANVTRADLEVRQEEVYPGRAVRYAVHESARWGTTDETEE